MNDSSPAPTASVALDASAGLVPEISVVVPARNERENLTPLIAELRTALDRVQRTWELIVVDDGSTDGSDAVLAEAGADDPRIRPVRIPPSGQSGALAAGFQRARGSVLVTLDADLQNDPGDLPQVLAALAHADVVSGIRARRRDAWHRLVSSRIANAVRRFVLGDVITDIGCSFKAYRRAALEGLPMFDGVHRFLPALCHFRGARVVEIPVSHRPRRYGVSSYGIRNRLWRGLEDLFGVFWLKRRLLHHVTHEDAQ